MYQFAGETCFQDQCRIPPWIDEFIKNSVPRETNILLHRNTWNGFFQWRAKNPASFHGQLYRPDTPNGLWKSEKTSSRLRVILSRLNLVNFLRMKIIFPSINNTLVNNRSIHGSGWERQHFGEEKPLRKKRVAIYLISFIAVQLKFVGPWWWV